MLRSFPSPFLVVLPLLHCIFPWSFAAPLQTEAGPGAILIDVFDSQDLNAIGHYHGGSGFGRIDEEEQELIIATDDVDDYFDISLSGTCKDLTPYSNHYLHIVYSGSNKFSISLQQHNAACNEDLKPYPETWDSVEAARYTTPSETDIWIPISHFNVNLTRVNAFALESFYTSDTTHFYKLELIPPAEVPDAVVPPESLATGNLVFKCKVPNTFAFAIDDGIPELAQEVMQILKEEDVKVTFFAVGKGLADESTNLTNVYKEALSLGHEVGLHSWSHPKMEALASDEEIDQQYQQSIEVVREKLASLFRPPYGTLGARTRQSLGRNILHNPTIVMWSIDVEDWKWGVSSTPERQMEAFKQGVERGGNLVVLHYLYPSTVGLLREMVRWVRDGGDGKAGRRIGTVGECLGED